MTKKRKILIEANDLQKSKTDYMGSEKVMKNQLQMKKAKFTILYKPVI